ncbi:tetratricopeptide repeat protein 27 [Brevipalpus obovatus]|uniref:tetratricopeptide repeat protein 27 n=1 Tax=Brevipalpus obovatus TaxID=246614 RepID=UPI003D9DC84A
MFFEDIPDCVGISYDSDTVASVRKHLDSCDHVADDSRVIKKVAVDCLNLFVRCNWICTNCQDHHYQEKLLDLLENHFSNPIAYLSPHERHIPGCIILKHLHLLCFAVSCLPLFNLSDITDCLWSVRVLMVKQYILFESDSSIHQDVAKRVGIIDNLIDSISDKNVQIRLCLDLCALYQWYREVQTSGKYLDKALKLCDLNIDLEGQLGKRTKFQQMSKCLLKLKISRKNNENNSSVNDDSGPESEKKSHLPTNVSLSDDTLLNQIKYDRDDDQNIVLSDLEQAIMCSLVSQMMISGSSDDELNREQIFYYLEFIINHAKIWSIAYKSLYLRCRQELDSSRRIERCWMQLEELIHEVINSQGKNCGHRGKFFYVLNMDPLWKLEKTLADVLYATGCTKTALEVYQKLNLWEQVVSCFLRLDRRDKAEALVRDQLKEGETPYLLCLLGDITGEIQHYHKALEISDNRSARAFKSLGDSHFNRKEYAECIGYYQRSLEINSMQSSCWSRLAFASLDTENYELAAKAYRRTVQFDDDNFEAWNNLSKAYIKMGDKRRAYKTLNEALKCNYDEWKIWENFLLVSLDLGEFSSVINAWHRLIDIKGKHIDDEVLEILVDSTISLGKDGSETQIHHERLLKELLKLLGRIGATSPGSGRFWLSYANLLNSENEKRLDNLDRILNHLIKSYQSFSRRPNWEKNSKAIAETMQNCLKVSEMLLSLHHEFSNKVSDSLYSFELWLKSVISTVNKNRERWENDNGDVATLLQELNNVLEKLSQITD